jgi:hypothetical protein
VATKGQEAATQLKPHIAKWLENVKEIKTQLTNPPLKHPLPEGFEEKFKQALVKVHEHLDVVLSEIAKYEEGRDKYYKNA